MEKEYQFQIYGLTRSKKNAYTVRSGRIVIGSDLKKELENLEMQIPAEVRDLGLIHPDIRVQFNSRSDRRDRDGLLTVILDLMVKCRVIAGDNIRNCNGTITILPAILGDEDSAHVTIRPRI